MNRRSLFSLLSLMGLGGVAAAASTGSPAVLSVSEMRARELAPSRGVGVDDAKDVMDMRLFRDNIWRSRYLVDIKRWPSDGDGNTIYEFWTVVGDGTMNESKKRYRLTPTQVEWLRVEANKQLADLHKGVLAIRPFRDRERIEQLKHRYKKDWGVEWTQPEAT